MVGTYRVLKLEKTHNGLRVTIKRGGSGGKPGVEDQIDVSATGLRLVQFGGRAIDPPSPLLRLPAEAGDTWKWEAAKKEGAPTQRTTFKLIGQEEIEVPAGKFKVLRVEQITELNGKSTRCEEWYAPRVGLVKKVFHHLGATKQVQELKSFKVEKN